MPGFTRILLIDDDAVDRMMVRRALAASDLNYELIEAADGATGLEQARNATFDCVLMDFRLPDVDAFHLLAALLAPQGGRQAVLMLTGEDHAETALKLMRAGALDHLAKDELTSSGLARAIRYATARRGFLAELEEARHDAEEKSEALDALNRQKSLLLSIIAHDLRNPFQVIMGLAEGLSTAVASKSQDAIERRARGVVQAAGQAHALMESLFSWASLQMDSSEFSVDWFELCDLARDVTVACEAAAERKGVALRLQCEEIKVHSNRDMLATILRNLVGNAVKFTPKGGEVTLSARGEEQVVLEVSDTGVGIAPDVLTELFTPDRRVTTVGTAGEAGSGLGLLLCHDLAERLGSKLEVASSPGQGTSFSVILASSGRLDKS